MTRLALNRLHQHGHRVRRDGRSRRLPQRPLGISAIERASPPTRGVLMEPIQGEAGVIVPPAGWLAGLRRVCDAITSDDSRRLQIGLGRPVLVRLRARRCPA